MYHMEKKMLAEVTVHQIPSENMSAYSHSGSWAYGEKLVEVFVSVVLLAVLLNEQQTENQLTKTLIEVYAKGLGG